MYEKSSAHQKDWGFAIAEGEWLRNALWARRFDMDLEKFAEKPTAGIECKNPDTGDE
jgi:hypothetical protein